MTRRCAPAIATLLLVISCSSTDDASPESNGRPIGSGGELTPSSSEVESTAPAQSMLPDGTAGTDVVGGDQHGIPPMPSIDVETSLTFTVEEPLSIRELAAKLGGLDPYAIADLNRIRSVDELLTTGTVLRLR